MGVFAAGTRARTMDFQAGDVGYVLQSQTHYIENTGDTDLVFLEMFASDHYEDISLGITGGMDVPYAASIDRSAPARWQGNDRCDPQRRDGDQVDMRLSPCRAGSHSADWTAAYVPDSQPRFS